MKRKRIAGVLLGLGCIVMGVLFAVDRFTEYEPFRQITKWWPILLGVAAVLVMVRSRPNFTNTFVLGCAGILLLRNHEVLMRSDRELWVGVVAFAAVLAGVWLIVRALRPRRGPETWEHPENHSYTYNSQFADEATPQEDTAPHSKYDGSGPKDGKTFYDGNATFDYVDILGGGMRVCTCRDLRGGSVTAILGGSEVDLRLADFSQPITVRATAILGGVELHVPPNVRVEIQGTNLLGGTDASKVQNRPYDPAHPVLTVQYFALMGGIDIT
ncbi:MAG: hypothetical protein LBC83_02175 [Oscillospiraceae bacterium]|jgi:hypothetical protein|nr:hypothetical protein [Oscillospiraceae bacterium]